MQLLVMRQKEEEKRQRHQQKLLEFLQMLDVTKSDEKCKKLMEADHDLNSLVFESEQDLKKILEKVGISGNQQANVVRGILDKV